MLHQFVLYTLYQVDKKIFLFTNITNIKIVQFLLEILPERTFLPKVFNRQRTGK